VKIQINLELRPEERRALEIQLTQEPLDRESAEEWVEGEVRRRLAALARELVPKAKKQTPRRRD
jgi:hypothetical protein